MREFASRKRFARALTAVLHGPHSCPGYYPHATGALGYKSPGPQIGDRSTWSQHFRNHGYHAARVSKIYHMGVPGGIESGGDGADDPLSWDENTTAKDRNGVRPAMVKLSRKTQMANDP